MRIEMLRALKDNFVYLLRADDEALKDVVVVDPGEAAPVLRALNAGERVSAVLCTHHHDDHVAGAGELKARFGAKVYAARGDLPRIESADVGLDADAELTILGERLSVLAMPGHTRHQVAYYFRTVGALFTGDTLFSAECGRLFEGTATEMWNSLRRLGQLPAETRVYFGHEYTLRNLEFVLMRERRAEVEAYREQVQAKISEGEDSTPSTIGIENAVNPFMRARDVASFAEWRSARDNF